MVRLWRRLPPLPLRAQNISVTTLEEHLFAKPYFDRQGLLVAEEQGEMIGFVHAGLGADSEQCAIDASLGVVALFVPPDEGSHDSVAAELLGAAEAYLRDHGVVRAIAGGVSPQHPFYLGLYGGALLPGIAESDKWLLEQFSSAGFERTGERHILRRSLTGFRPPVDRDLMRIRRTHQLESCETPVADHWCEACTLGVLNRRRYKLVSRSGNEVAAMVDVWDMEPLSGSWGLNAMGVCCWDGCEGPSEPLCHLFLLGETMKKLSSEGVSILEIQVSPEETARRDVCRRLGFEQVERGLVLVKRW